jgi:erythromycin esterase
MIASASAFIPAAGNAENRERSSDGDRPNWIAENLIPVRSLDAADEAYDDLEPMVGAIGSAKLVLLGESSHGAGSDFKAKVRLIKFLCRRMDFDVIAWESGFHAMNQVNAALRSGEDAVTAAKQGIFTLWSDAREVEPLFKWVQQSWTSRRPVEMAGFDTQFTARGADALLFDDMRQFAGNCPNPELRQAVGADVERAIAAYKEIAGSPASAGAVANVGQAVDGIMRVIARHRGLFEETSSARELSFLERSLENFRCVAELNFEASQGTRGTVGVQLKDPTAFFNRRDAENAQNLRWLLDVGYPGRKIIVWAHNAHIVKVGFGRNFGPIGETAGGMVPMGKIVASGLRDDYYAIGFTSYDGEDSWVTAPKATPIPTAPSDSLEARLHALGRPYAFLDLRGHKSWGGKILKERIFVPAPGNSTRTPDGIFAAPPSVFDGVFFVDRMTPATPIGSR